MALPNAGPGSAKSHAVVDSFRQLEPRVAQLLEEEEVDVKEIDGLDVPQNLIGFGSFGEVRAVSWRRTPCAAKMIYSFVEEDQKRLFRTELQLLVACRHPNIVQFLGFVDSPFIILMERVAQGDLRSYWKSHRMTLGHKTKVCIDVLCAIEYLHNRKPSSIIHRDIKPTNVLITRSGVAKLTDFGLGRVFRGVGLDGSKHEGIVYPSHGIQKADGTAVESSRRQARNARASHDDRPGPPVTTIVGTVPYMAPEAATSQYTEKVDIYSAAVTFYELFEQATFDPEMPFAWAMAPDKVKSIIKMMGDTDPRCRPSAHASIDLFVGTGLKPTTSGTRSHCTLS